MPLFLLGDLTKTIGVLVQYMMDFMNHMGEYCVKMLNAGLKIYKTLVLSATEVLSIDYQKENMTDKTADLWNAVSKVSGIIGGIATTLIVLLFLISLMNEAWNTQHEFEMAAFLKSFARFFATIVLVNNAVLIVSTLFTLTSLIAGGIGDTGLQDLSTEIKMEDAAYLRYTVSGFEGLISALLCLVAFLVIFGSAVTILIEVYQRVFKIFVLIPFSGVSFAAFTMSDANRGSDVFHGYVRAITATAIEAVVITIMIVFSLRMVNGNSMGELLGRANVKTEVITIANSNDIVYLQKCYAAGSFSTDPSVINPKPNYSGFFASSTWNGVPDENTDLSATDDSTLSSYCIQLEGKENILISKELRDSLDQVNRTRFDEEGKSLGVLKTNDVATFVMEWEGRTMNLMDFSVHADQSLLQGERSSGKYSFEPISVVIYETVDFYHFILMVFTYMFPCMLCAGSIKMAGQISNMIVGR